MKTASTKPRIDQDMASEYRFDYGKAKPNRFVNKLNLNIGWTVGRFVAEEKKKEESGKKKAAPKKSGPCQDAYCEEASNESETEKEEINKQSGEGFSYHGTVYLIPNHTHGHTYLYNSFYQVPKSDARFSKYFSFIHICCILKESHIYSPPT